ncbi:hypothetical protein [Pseudomonas sp. KCJK8993]|uniref:hypothetical protein n=1 Tax=Pseudomonas sp. KCJK8993 TaxID=3344565 RepID=UPI003906C777
MRLSRLLLTGVIGLAIAPLAQASSTADNAEKAQLRKLFCESRGGSDITALGELKKSDDVGAVVVCKLPPSPTTVVENQAAATFSPLPLTPVTATLAPPSGVYKLAPGASSINTSCSANLAIAKWAGFPSTSNGNASLNCRGYNTSAGGSTLGCNIQWTGPTQVAIGVTPYGGQVAVNFSCQAIHLGSMGTVMDFSYSDPVYSRIRYGSVQATGSLTITQ